MSEKIHTQIVTLKVTWNPARETTPNTWNWTELVGDDTNVISYAQPTTETEDDND